MRFYVLKLKKKITRIRKGLFKDKWQKVVESDYTVIQIIVDWQERKLWQYVYLETSYKEMSIFMCMT